jgi:transcriptional regulator with XRE-family HTH domain
MTTELKSYIKQRCSELGLSVRGLQRETGIARDTLSKILESDTKNARLSTMVILARALKIHPFTLFRYFLNQTDLPKYTTTNALHKFDATGFIADATYPDNCEVRVNETFTKIWVIQNIGSMDWIGRKLVCMDTQPTGNFDLPENIVPPNAFRGLKPTTRQVLIPNTRAGEIIEIEVEFTAPFYPCHVMSYWKMVDAEENFCFPQSEGLSCVVNVLAI